jgi:DNA repair protein RadC
LTVATWVPIESSLAAASNEDLLGQLIGPKTARRLYRGNLGEIFDLAASGRRAHRKCLAAKELLRRALAEDLNRRDALTSPAAVRDYLRLWLRGYEYEAFVVLFLDSQNRVVAAEELFRGTLTQTSVYPREVLKAALRHNAASVILSHNHPSGVAEPSVQDQSLTRTLSEALALVDVKVLDHFVVAGATVLSFAERGLSCG